MKVLADDRVDLLSSGIDFYPVGYPLSSGAAIIGRVIAYQFILRLGAGLERNHRTGTGWVDRFVDRYQDEPDRNYQDGCSVPSRPTIYRDGIGTDRNGTGWDKRDDTSRYFKK
uniref:Uncharacterized protein n=1 Tax=Solanum tuberosum TaxID=4113 RepID=M1DSG1_SOLTU